MVPSSGRAISPYRDLPSRQFWKKGVREAIEPPHDFYRKKFEIDTSMQIMTAGSCFAQHIASRLRARGYSVIDAEPAPAHLRDRSAKRFGYRTYSARYGNIYTARQLLQLLLEASGRFAPQDIIWERNGRFFDALRPGVEPDGLESPEEVRAHRLDHLSRVNGAVKKADLLIFTFGLTEAWQHRASETVYPTAPGTIAGSFDPTLHSFVNFSYGEVLADFKRVRRFLKRRRPDMKFLVTVSPVPLAATAEDAHVLSATIHSKSILRAVAGALASQYEDVDYFPSYELIATPFFGNFYDESKREVTPEGVDMAMASFIRAHGGAAPQSEPAVEPKHRARSAAKSAVVPAEDREAVVCEEILLEAFAP